MLWLAPLLVRFAWRITGIVHNTAGSRFLWHTRWEFATTKIRGFTKSADAQSCSTVHTKKVTSQSVARASKDSTSDRLGSRTNDVQDKINQAEQYLRKLHTENANAQRLTHAYNLLLAEHARHHRTAECERLLSAMKARSIRRDAASYSFLFSCCFDTNDVATAEHWLQSMQTEDQLTVTKQLASKFAELYKRMGYADKARNILSSTTRDWQTPWVQLKYHSANTSIYSNMLRGASPDAKPGDLVAVYTPEGKRYGSALYNPAARVPVRMVEYGSIDVRAKGEDFLMHLLERALELRQHILRIPDVTTAYRVFNSDGDGLGGLIVDRYSDVLYVEVHSLGVIQRLPRWIPWLHSRLGTTRHLVHVSDRAAQLEHIKAKDVAALQHLQDERPVTEINEHGIRYQVNFATGHKTGFFCDQRENRARLGAFARNMVSQQGRQQPLRMLDLCCYTGGFSLAASVIGGVRNITAVDLDEQAIEQARLNAKLNAAEHIHWVHADAFGFARQSLRSIRDNQSLWDIVVVDPPKLISAKQEDTSAGRKKYEDLNELAVQLVSPGGLFVTCSCSGMLSPADFRQLISQTAHRQGRRLQILDFTGAAADHPVWSGSPEGEYLKVVWARVW